MKTLNIKPLKLIVNIALMALLLPACANSDGNKNEKSGMDKPKIDIHTAVLTDNLEVIKQHIDAGSDLNEKEVFGGSTPLISAATFGKIEIAKALIDAGADLNMVNNDGSTALHSAAFFCRVEIVQMLIDAKSDKTLKNKFGSTARESVIGPFAEIKPVYELMQQQLGPMGMQLDMSELEKTRPVIAMMLQ